MKRKRSQKTSYITTIRNLFSFDFRSDGSFNVYITLDNGQDVSFSGTYSYANGQIRMVALNNPILPLDETTAEIVPHMGLVGEFATPIMRCGAAMASTAASVIRSMPILGTSSTTSTC